MPTFANFAAEIMESSNPLEHLMEKRRKETHLGGGRDPVLECLGSMKTRNGQWGRSLLENGKIEMQLKLFIGLAWERQSPQNRYAMDKLFFPPAVEVNGQPAAEAKGGLDLLALSGTRAKFWIETKCSFFEDHSDGRRSAKKALKQADQTKGKLIRPLRSCPVYIVHFVNSVPTTHFPPFVLKRYKSLTDKTRKFAKKRGMNDPILFRECQLEWLRSIYAGHRGEDAKRKYDSSAVVELSKTPVLKALVVKLK